MIRFFVKTTKKDLVGETVKPLDVRKEHARLAADSIFEMKLWI